MEVWWQTTPTVYTIRIFMTTTKTTTITEKWEIVRHKQLVDSLKAWRVMNLNAREISCFEQIITAEVFKTKTNKFSVSMNFQRCDLFLHCFLEMIVTCLRCYCVYFPSICHNWYKIRREAKKKKKRGRVYKLYLPFTWALNYSSYRIRVKRKRANEKRKLLGEMKIP